MTAVTNRQFVTNAPPMRQVKAFDGIRGIGVTLVVLQHAWAVADSISGYIDLFFVISGFLITTLLFEEQRNVGDVSMRNFYGRRAVRLLPALLVVLVLFYLPILFVTVTNWNADNQFLLQQVSLESLATLFYVHNIFFSPLLGSFQYMGQMWSLSLEEQFYLLGALATWVSIRKGWMKQFGVVLAAFIAFVWVARGLGHGGPGQFWFQRPDAIALGVLLAIIHATAPTDLSDRAKVWLRRMGWIAFAGLIFALLSSSKLIERLGGPYVPLYPTDVNIEAPPQNLSPDELRAYADQAIQVVLREIPNGNYWVRWGFTLATLCSAIVVFALVRLRDDFRLTKWLSGRVVCYFGVLSYAIYISHYQLFKLIDPGFQHGLKWVIPKMVLAFALGIALHHWVEKPVMKRFRRRFTRRAT
jgi:peptidoglycan/LPS O-acetylase OafA/YrhL